MKDSKKNGTDADAGCIEVCIQEACFVAVAAEELDKANEEKWLYYLHGFLKEKTKSIKLTYM
jgi:hypothetical protein